MTATLPESTDALLAAARKVADAASDVLESKPEKPEDWATLGVALQAFADTDIAHADARDREAKAQVLGETLSARLANVLGDAETLAEFILESKAPDLLVKAAETLKENVRTVYHSAPKAHPTLEDKLQERVSSWLKRMSPVLARNEGTGASLKLHVGDAATDDDGTLVLRWSFDEKLEGPFFDDDEIGRVPGVKGP